MPLHARRSLIPKAFRRRAIAFRLAAGVTHLFPERSFNVALSTIASARSRLSRVFSSSSVFSRLASKPAEFGFPFLHAGVGDATVTERPTSCSFINYYNLLRQKSI